MYAQLLISNILFLWAALFTFLDGPDGFIYWCETKGHRYHGLTHLLSCSCRKSETLSFGERDL